MVHPGNAPMKAWVAVSPLLTHGKAELSKLTAHALEGDVCGTQISQMPISTTAPEGSTIYSC